MIAIASSFISRLRAAQERNASLLCVGLDPDPSRFPSGIERSASAIADFNRAIIAATADLVCCYKPNLGFYIASGTTGLRALERLRADVPAEIPILLDAKVGDMDNTTAAYARGFFDTWGFDAVTANPFLGRDALQPLLDYADRGVFVLSKTSNPDSGFLQDRILRADAAEPEQTVTLNVVRHARAWNEHGNVGLVVGATYPAQLAQVRAAAPELPILVPGVGAQAGDLEAAVRAGLDADRAGLLISSSRAVIYASSGRDYQIATRASATAFRDAIEAVRYA